MPADPRPDPAPTAPTPGPPVRLGDLGGPSGPSARWGVFFSLVWLIYLGPAAAQVVDGGRPAGERIAAGVLLVAFVATYLSLLVGLGAPEQTGERGAVGDRRSIHARTALIAAIGVGGALGLGEAWLVTLAYTAAVLAMLVPYRFVPATIVAILAVAEGLLLLVGGTSYAGIGFGIGVAGFATLGFRRFRDLVVDLREAREENARLAVADERVRIARELHDLLGHSLSVVAVKSQLAERLLERGQPDRAADEIRDVRGVAREALHEVRGVVEGYRRRPLATEVASAADALRAGEIAVETELPAAPVPDAVEDVVAWVVREGTTNVLRHARASTCTVRVRRERDAVVATLADDGTGASPGGVRTIDPAEANGGGNGLRGLAERLADVDGTLRIGPAPGGGTVLEATIPVEDAEPVGASA